MFPRSATGQLDLRVQGPMTVALDAVVGGRPNQSPPVDFDRKLRSYLPRAGAGSTALDLGCGQQPDRPLLEAAGYAYEGVDFEDPGAPLLADAHRLPFGDGSFDLVWTIAVLEQLLHPRTRSSRCAADA
ncbi:MAG: class I SAM-dependent methyltransferase [Actinomycetota bacterium]|nr:class I SAM-dependent methyltransferase [Actinomycetota bacterium]